MTGETRRCAYTASDVFATRFGFRDDEWTKANLPVVRVAFTVEGKDPNQLEHWMAKIPPEAWDRWMEESERVAAHLADLSEIITLARNRAAEILRRDYPAMDSANLRMMVHMHEAVRTALRIDARVTAGAVPIGQASAEIVESLRRKVKPSVSRT